MFAANFSSPSAPWSSARTRRKKLRRLFGGTEWDPDKKKK